MENQLGIAVIGCGYWGGNYVRLFSELPQTSVVAVCDERPEALEKLRRRFPDVALVRSVDELLTLPGIDAVVICTPAASHYSVARQCLEADKHVLLEKPMTTAVADAQDLIDLASVRRMTLMVGHIYLYNLGIRKIKTYIDQGSMGELYYLYSQRTNLGPIRYDVNALWDLAPHDISIMNYLLGRTPEWVSAVGRCALGNNREDVGFIALGYDHEMVANIHVSWADPEKVRQIVAVGSEQRVVFNDLNPQEPVRIYEKGVGHSTRVPTNFGEQFAMRNGDIISPNVGLSEPLKEQCLHFVDCVLSGKQPVSDGQNGLDVVRVMVAIDESLKRKGVPIELTTERENGYHEQAVGQAVADFVR